MTAGVEIHPSDALRRIAFLLERAREPSYRVKAFRKAAATIDDLGDAELVSVAARGELRSLAGIGEVTEKVVLECLAGARPEYLRRLEERGDEPVATGGQELLRALKGDCHTHSTWSDGGSPIREMALAARDIGHEYIVLTDHSQRLTVAKGLSPERLKAQLREIDEINDELAPFRILTGMEVDILEDGDLDMTPKILGRLDVVVASVHSKLRMERDLMTRRMVRAMENPHADILGHCTGRLVTGRGRPESQFDEDAVFGAVAAHDKAVEVNSRPERLDPPRRLLTHAVAEHGCRVSIDTDAHAPGQLSWLPYGCERAEECGVTADRVVNALGVEDLLAWAGAHA